MCLFVLEIPGKYFCSITYQFFAIFRESDKLSRNCCYTWNILIRPECKVCNMRHTLGYINISQYLHPKGTLFGRNFCRTLKKFHVEKIEIFVPFGCRYWDNLYRLINTICRPNIYLNILAKIWIKRNFWKNIYLGANCCFFWIDQKNSKMCLLYIDNKWDISQIKMSPTGHKTLSESIWLHVKALLMILIELKKVKILRKNRQKIVFFLFFWKNAFF